MVTKDSTNIGIFEVFEQAKTRFFDKIGGLQKLHYNACSALPSHFLCTIMHFWRQNALLCQPIPRSRTLIPLPGCPKTPTNSSCIPLQEASVPQELAAE